MSGFYDSSGNMQQLQLGSFGGSHGSAPPSFGGSGFGGANPASGFGTPEGVSGGSFGQYYDFLKESAMAPNQLPEGYVYNPQTGMGQQTGRGFWGTTNNIPFNPNQRVGLTGSQQMQGAALGDFQNVSAANEANYQNRVNANNQFLSAAQGRTQDILDAGQKAQGEFDSASSNLQQQGQEFFAGQESRVNEAIDGYENLAAQQASSVSAGLARQNRTQRQQIDSQAKLGNPEAISAAYAMEQEQNMKQSEVMTSLASQFNQGLSGIRMSGVSALGQAGATQQGYNQMASNMTQMGISVANSAVAQAAAYESQSLGQYAQMVANNPYSPVSFLPTLMSFFQFSQTPGANSFKGFSEELLF